MTAGPSIDPAQFLNEQLAQASPDLLRDLLTAFVNALLAAQADAVCGAGYGERTPERVNSRNSYRHRDLDTPPKGAPPASAPSTSRSPNSGRGRCIPTGCLNGARVPNVH